jgi:hypothetical protein
MDAMFSGAGSNATTFKLIGLEGWDTSNVTNMEFMFYGTGENATTWSIGDISIWNTSKVTDMRLMFESAGHNASYTLDLSGWKVPLVEDYYGFDSGVETKVIEPNWVK